MHPRVILRLFPALALAIAGTVVLGTSIGFDFVEPSAAAGVALLAAARALMTVGMPSAKRTPHSFHALLHPRGGIRTHAIEWCAGFALVFHAAEPSMAWLEQGSTLFMVGLLLLMVRAILSVRHLVEAGGTVEVTGLFNGLVYGGQTEDTAVELDARRRMILQRADAPPFVAGRLWLDLDGAETVRFVMDHHRGLSPHLKSIADAAKALHSSSNSVLIHGPWAWGAALVLFTAILPDPGNDVIPRFYAVMMVVAALASILRDGLRSRALVRRSEALPDTLVLRRAPRHQEALLLVAGGLLLLGALVTSMLQDSRLTRLTIAALIILGTRLGLALVEAAGRASAANVVAATISGSSVQLLWPWLLRVRAFPVMEVSAPAGPGQSWKLGDLPPLVTASVSPDAADRFRRALEAARHGAYR